MAIDWVGLLRIEFNFSKLNLNLESNKKETLTGIQIKIKCIKVKIMERESIRDGTRDYLTNSKIVELLSGFRPSIS